MNEILFAIERTWWKLLLWFAFILALSLLLIPAVTFISPRFPDIAFLVWLVPVAAGTLAGWQKIVIREMKRW